MRTVIKVDGQEITREVMDFEFHLPPINDWWTQDGFLYPLIQAPSYFTRALEFNIATRMTNERTYK